jgi:hypothetical protein
MAVKVVSYIYSASTFNFIFKIMLLQLQNITFGFSPEKQIFKDLTFGLEQGKIYARGRTVQAKRHYST